MKVSPTMKVFGTIGALFGVGALLLLIALKNSPIVDVHVEQHKDRAMVHTLLFGTYSSNVSAIEIDDAKGNVIWKVSAEKPRGSFHIAGFELRVGTNSSTLIQPMSGRPVVEQPASSEFILQRGQSYTVGVCDPPYSCQKVRVRFD